MKKIIFTIILSLVMAANAHVKEGNDATALPVVVEKVEGRVPYIFVGNSSSPEPLYREYEEYRNKVDQRDSRGYPEYYLNQALVEEVRRVEGVNSVHVMIRDIARDGLCKGVCFRAYVYLNGNQDTGVLVATFVTSPGRGRKTPYYKNASLRTYDKNVRWLRGYEKPTMFRGSKNFDMYRIYGSKSYPGPIPNMPNAMFISRAIALHGSFGEVNGEKQSAGCIRLFPDESYWVHSLVRESDGQLTMDVFHTRN